MFYCFGMDRLVRMAAKMAASLYSHVVKPLLKLLVKVIRWPFDWYFFRVRHVERMQIQRAELDRFIDTL